MPILDVKKRFSKWKHLLKKRDDITLLALLQEAPTVEVADFLQKQGLRTCIKLLSLFDQPTRATLFSQLTEARKVALYETLPRRALAEILAHMPSDTRADFYKNLTHKQQAQLLPYLDKKIKQNVITLSGYPSATAGGIMSTDFATVSNTMSVQQAIDKMRADAPDRKMMYYLYVVNEDMQMIGFASIKDLIISDPTTSISKILKDTFVFARLDEDRELVAQKIERYNLVALPVLNDELQLVGIVSHDDALEVIRAEQTEDMEKFMGIVSDEHADNYLQTSSLQHFKKRIMPLATLFVASFASAFLAPRFGKILLMFPVLSFYQASINDAGGNAGSQAAMVIIRALALGQISLQHWLTILWKELRVALLSVCCLFLLSFIRVWLFTDPLGSNMPVQGIYTVAFTISLALSLQVVFSTLIGASLPLVIKLFKGDPVLAASPAITTLVDVTGLLIYTTTASLLLL